jgi:hypothetical protein
MSGLQHSYQFFLLSLLTKLNYWTKYSNVPCSWWHYRRLIFLCEFLLSIFFPFRLYEGNSGILKFGTLCVTALPYFFWMKHRWLYTWVATQRWNWIVVQNTPCINSNVILDTQFGDCKDILYWSLARSLWSNYHRRTADLHGLLWRAKRLEMAI